MVAPARKSRASYARASHAPSSTAAQSCSAADERHEDVARARTEPTTTPTSHGAWPRRASSLPSSRSWSVASTSTRSASCSVATRARSAPGTSEVNAAPRLSTPLRAAPPERAERRAHPGELARVGHGPHKDELREDARRATRRGARAARASPRTARRRRSTAPARRALRVPGAQRALERRRPGGEWPARAPAAPARAQGRAVGEMARA